MSKKSIEDAWSAFYEESKLDSYDDMIAQGWKTIAQVAKEFNMPHSTVESRLRDGKLYCVKRRVMVNGKTRVMNFVRPVV